MLKTNLKIALRNLYREKLYSLINVAGLSLAITCCLILGFFLRSELTYDQHFEGHENIYRVVVQHTTYGVQEPVSALSASNLGLLLTQEFEEFEDFVTVTPALRNPSQNGGSPVFVSRGSEFAYWDKVFGVTDNFFEVFSHEILYGDPETALVNPQGAAISQTLSERYFGDTNPVGQTLETTLGEPLVVNLVFADVPNNSHLKYDLLVSHNWRPSPSSPPIRGNQISLNQTSYNYVVAEDGFDPANFPAMAESFFEQNQHPMIADGRLDMIQRFTLEPLSKVHYASQAAVDELQGNPSYIYAFGFVAFFTLLVACINYTNLSTARSIRRSREVGLKKILGANKSELIVQFITEAILYATISTILAVMVAEVLAGLPQVTQLFGAPIELNLSEEPQLIFWLALLTLCIGLLAGIYPALYLSSWAPLSALVHSGKSAGKGNIQLRHALVLAQFTISIAVIASTLLMSNQMRFISSKELGYDRENLVTIRMTPDQIEQGALIKNELLQNTNILGATISVNIPGETVRLTSTQIQQQDGSMALLRLNLFFTDSDYVDVMGMEMTEGVDFSDGITSNEQRGFLVNEALVAYLGWDLPIGKSIFSDGRVIGVVRDFNIHSLHRPVEPLVIGYEAPMAGERQLGAGFIRYMTVRIAAGETSNTIGYLRDVFEQFDPVHPVDFQFLDDRLDALYQSETSLMNLVSIFAGICIFIAALGLFGLASFTTDQRSREIAIRKVLGASTGQIIGMLSKNVLGLTLIGAVFASIIAYWAINEWLSSFAYRADINMWAFVIAALATLTVALVTMALQSYRTAQADPIDALRAE